MESAAERKARLKALRQEAASAEEGTEAARPATAAAAPAASAAPEPPTLKFRNYAPRDEKIEHEKVCSSAWALPAAAVFIPTTPTTPVTNGDNGLTPCSARIAVPLHTAACQAVLKGRFVHTAIVCCRWRRPTLRSLPRRRLRKRMTTSWRP